jgi:hypothetical protein
MKQKKLQKTLLLNKKTVSNLNTMQMGGLKGGEFTHSADLPCNTMEMFCTVATCERLFCENSAACSDDISCRCY